MSIVKIIAGILITAGIALWVFAAVSSPILQVQIIAPQRGFGDELTVTTTVYNVAPFEKGVAVSDNSAVPVLLIDGQEPPDVDHTSISETVKFGPFSMKKITSKLILNQSSTTSATPLPQLLGTDARQLTVEPGTHKVKAAWGGHTSNETTFTVN